MSLRSDAAYYRERARTATTPGDRRLWTSLADEIDQYLGHEPAPDLADVVFTPADPDHALF